MTPDEKYLFDLNGYLVIDDVLTPEQVTLANEAIDHHADQIRIRKDSLATDAPTLQGERGRGELGGMMEWADPWGPLFRSMLTLPTLMPYLNEVMGKGFRVDHMMFLLTMDKGTEGFYFHGKTGPDWDPDEYYLHRNGRMYSGLAVMAIQLRDVNPGDGGFACVPGSHKANFLPPDDLLYCRAFQEHIRQVPCRAGGAILFTEALTHGTLPWTSDQPRRSLLTRYNRGGMAYVPAGKMPAWAGEREKAVLQPPYHKRLNRPVLED